MPEIFFKRTSRKKLAQLYGKVHKYTQFKDKLNFNKQNMMVTSVLWNSVFLTITQKSFMTWANMSVWIATIYSPIIDFNSSVGVWNLYVESRLFALAHKKKKKMYKTNQLAILREMECRQTGKRDAFNT